MIELYSSDTPNGKKIGIMLEEIKLPYKVHKVDLGQGEQFKKEFIVEFLSWILNSASPSEVPIASW